MRFKLKHGGSHTDGSHADSGISRGMPPDNEMIDSDDSD